jgi:hypothetical protein
MCHVARGTTDTAFSQKFQGIEKLSNLPRALRWIDLHIPCALLDHALGNARNMPGCMDFVLCLISRQATKRQS